MRWMLCLVVLVSAAAVAAGSSELSRVTAEQAAPEAGFGAVAFPVPLRLGTQPVMSLRRQPVSGGTDLAGKLDTIGGTTYDLQTNGPMASRIVYDPGYGIHAVWTFSPDPGGNFPNRNMRYNFFNVSGSPPSWSFNSGPNFMNWGTNVLAARSGFGNLDVDPNAHLAYVSAHRGDTTRATVLRQTAPGSGSFQECLGPNGMPWPVIGLSSTGKVHVALTLDEGINNRTRLYYSRVDPWGTWVAPATLYGTAPFPGFPNYGLAAGKHSQKVAVVWSVTTPPRELGYVRTSANDGATWSAATQLTFPATFHPGSETIPSFSVSSLYPFYDSRDTLHIVASLNPVVCRGADTVAYVLPAEVWHWSVATGWNFVARGTCDTTHLAGPVGYNSVYATRPTIGEGGAGEFVCVWEEFDSMNVEPATGQLRADILGARSTDGGVSWGTKTRITDPNQTSKRFPCIADRMKGDTCLIAYMIDLIAGSVVLGQGEASNNPVVVQRVAKTDFHVQVNGPDVGVERITSPAGTLPFGTVVTPACSVYNNGNTTATYQVRMRVGTFYDSSASVASHAPGTYRYVTFPAWTANQTGVHAVTSFTNLVGDVDRSNDTTNGNCEVLPASTPGWVVRASYPAGEKNVKDGAWLAYDAGSARIYAARGCKTSDFHSYNPQSDSWTRLTSWPFGTEGKPPNKGASGCANGTGAVYATKGNNTQGFWQYEAGNWVQRKDVPLGPTGKKVKAGADLVWAQKSGIGYVYLLKGYKNEFWRYHTTGDSWHQLPDAPIGASVKWGAGSWVAYDGTAKLYAHKPKFHEFYAYDVNAEAWGPALQAMPIPGSAGSKKSKDGSCGAFLGTDAYALKGGNTQEFWKYSVAANSWAEQETMPRGTSGKKPKAGADMAAVPGSNALFALKGNKTLEFWRYCPGTALAPKGGSPAEMAAGSVRPQPGFGLLVAPNPAQGRTKVSFSVPAAGNAALRLYDVTGALTATLSAGRRNAGSHTATLDAGALSRGIYVLKLECEGRQLTRKLVVE